jgi:hypothetical protein
VGGDEDVGEGMGVGGSRLGRCLRCEDEGLDVGEDAAMRLKVYPHPSPQNF